MRFAILLLICFSNSVLAGITVDAGNFPLRAEFTAEVMVFDTVGTHTGTCDVTLYRGEPHPGGSALDNHSVDPSITLDCEAGGYDLHFAHDGAGGDRIAQFTGRGGPSAYFWDKTFGYDFVEVSPPEVASWVDMTASNGQALSLNPSASTAGGTSVSTTMRTLTTQVVEPGFSYWVHSGNSANVEFDFSGTGPITRVVGAGSISQAVPEPSAFLMLGMVCVGVGFVNKVRRGGLYYQNRE